MLRLIRSTHRSVFMTGRAGTGKSTFLRYICRHTRKRHVVLAPTGIAAVNVGGMTLHSFFRIPFKPILPDDPEFALSRLKKRMKYPKSHKKLLENLDLIIIDEISMVRADVLDFIDKILRVYSGNMPEPFGGKQMLFVGDVFQLEPVVTSDMRDVLSRVYKRPFFFSARVFDDFSIVPIELRKVYRQSDSSFIAILDRLRMGRAEQGDIAVINSRYDLSSADASESDKIAMTLAPRRDMVDAINESHLNALPSKEVTYIGSVKGDFPENSFPTNIDLTLKEGAQVVFLRNDYERRWVNGTIGVVVRTDPESVSVRTENGETHTLEQEVWSNVKYEFDEKENTVTEKVLGTFVQFPLRLAWALTIHKSQGLTFNNVVIDIGQGAFSGGQSYVALSRCSSLAGIRLTAMFRQSDFFVNPAIVEFASQFNSSELIDSALDDARADALYSSAAEAFNAGDVDRAIDCLSEASALRNDFDKPAVRRLLKVKVASLTRLRGVVESLKGELSAQRSKMVLLAEEYVTMGNYCAEDGEMTPAFANYEKALSLVTDFAPAVVAKAKALAKIGEYKKAKAELQAFIRRCPSSWEAIVALAEMAYRKEKDSEEALLLFLKAFSINKENVALCERIASLYDEMGQPDEARRFKSLAAKLRSRRK